MIWQDVVRFASVDFPGGPLTYPGLWRRTWMRLGNSGVSFCVGMELER